MSIRIENRNGALWVVMDRPSRHNALNAEAFKSLREACRRSHQETPTALVITGANGAFTAGGDLRWFMELASASPDRLRSAFIEAAEVVWALEDLPCPVVVGVNGVCVAGGLEFVCAADLVIAARSATFADGHARVGLLPLGGSVSRLVARVGSANANRLLLTGSVMDAEEALRIGLVGEVVDDEALPTALEDVCAALATQPQSALSALTRQSRQVGEDRIRARRAELDEALANVERDEALEGLRAFLERREPNFQTTQNTDPR